MNCNDVILSAPHFLGWHLPHRILGVEGPYSSNIMREGKNIQLRHDLVDDATDVC